MERTPRRAECELCIPGHSMTRRIVAGPPGILTLDCGHTLPVPATSDASAVDSSPDNSCAYCGAPGTDSLCPTHREALLAPAVDDLSPDLPGEDEAEAAAHAVAAEAEEEAEHAGYHGQPSNGCTICADEAAQVAAAEAEEAARVAAGGREVCPTCHNRSVQVRVTPTRQYGGGSNTYYKCETPGCKYAEVCV